MMRSGFFNLNSGVKVPVLPADFLIDENQKIYKAYYGKNYSDHLEISDVLEWK